MNIDQKRRLYVIGALLILLGISTYQFGFKMLVIALVAVATSVAIEMLAKKLRKEKQDFTSYFTLPLVVTLLTTPNVYNDGHVWMIAVTVAFGLFFAKALFGGQDKNVFNAEALGIIFMILSFPAYVVNTKTGHATGDLFVFVALGLGVLLVLLKAISPYTIISYLATLIVMFGIFYLVDRNNPNPFTMLVSSNFVFVGIFMATEKSSGAKLPIGMLIYGFVLGLLTWLVYTESPNKEYAAVYTILLGNALVPLIDVLVDKISKKEEVYIWKN